MNQMKVDRWNMIFCLEFDFVFKKQYYDECTWNQKNKYMFIVMVYILPIKVFFGELELLLRISGFFPFFINY